MKYILTERQYRLITEKYKISDGERVILSDTENFKQIVPLTYTASCKYGANTKWCVTGEKGKTSFDYYKNSNSDVSMIMIKNPEIKEKLGTGKFSFNLYDNFLEIHNDKSNYFNLFDLAKKADIFDEVKSLLDDYIKFMRENRGVENLKVISSN